MSPKGSRVQGRDEVSIAILRDDMGAVMLERSLNSVCDLSGTDGHKRAFRSRTWRPDSQRPSIQQQHSARESWV